MACLLAVLVPSSPAAAHATLVGTDPADGAVLAESPGQATLTFDEAVSLPAEGVRVFDASGGPVTSTASSGDSTITVDLPDRLADGTYVVVWRAVSADGHPIAGSLTFSVGRPSVQVVSPPPPDRAGPAVGAVLSVANAVTYVGLLLAVGLGLFAVVILGGAGGAPRASRRLRPVVTWSTVASVVAVVAALPLTVVTQRALGPADVLTSEAWTGVTPTALVAAALLAGGLVLVRVALGDRRSVAQSRVALGLGAGLAVVTPALTGHSRGMAPQVPVVALDVLHVLAGSVWLGGLVGLALSLPVVSGRRSDAALVLARFSTLAASVLALLVATGGLLAWRIVASWENLFGTRYGWLLLAKIALACVAVTIAAWNRYVLLPRTRSDHGHQRHRSAVHRVGHVVAAEAGVVVLVLALTGFLVNQSPRAEALVVPAGRTGVQATTLGEDLKVLVTLSPAEVGPNTLRVQVQDLTGEPVEPSRLPVISLNSDDVDLGEVRSTSDAAGTFRSSVVLPAAGTWRVQVSLRLTEFDNPVGVVTFHVTEGRTSG